MAGGGSSIMGGVAMAAAVEVEASAAAIAAADDAADEDAWDDFSMIQLGGICRLMTFFSSGQR